MKATNNNCYYYNKYINKKNKSANVYPPAPPAPSAPPAQARAPVITTRVNIQTEIEDLTDLINLAKKVDIDDNLILSPNVEYNIDLKMLKTLIPAMEDLNNMIGQSELKNQLANIILYYSLNMNTKQSDLLHTVIYGEPGMGKTEFAQKIANIYIGMGVLKNKIFKKVKRCDLIGEYLGHTALKTESVIKSVRGGVLFIDEAYSIGNNAGKNTKDSFSKECIDVINQSLTEMREKPDNYYILIIAGYKDELKRNFFGMNDGLERRFSVHFTMTEYSENEMMQIFKTKVLEEDWSLENGAISEEFINKNKSHFKYHGGDMELLFVKCKIAHSKNLISAKSTTKFCLSKIDVEDGMMIFIKNSDRGDNNDKINYNMYL